MISFYTLRYQIEQNLQRIKFISENIANKGLSEEDLRNCLRSISLISSCILDDVKTLDKLINLKNSLHEKT